MAVRANPDGPVTASDLTATLERTPFGGVHRAVLSREDFDKEEDGGGEMNFTGVLRHFPSLAGL